MYYVYLLYSSSANKYYVGYTDNVDRRLYEHNHPEIKSKFTAKYVPWTLSLAIPVSEGRGQAMKIEKFIN